MTVKFIAEVCSNHNQDFNRAANLIKSAKRIGCYGVKFQMFKLEKLFHSTLLNHPDYQFVKLRKRWELKIKWLSKIKKVCDSEGIKFGCTPFDLDSVAELLPYVDFYKVSSYDVLRLDLIQAIARFRKPVIISTGMATKKEINNAISAFVGEYDHRNYDLTLLHCVSSYPVESTDCHLHHIGYLNLLSNQWIKIGWSDHSVNPNVIYRACYKWDAKVIEFHLDLNDRMGWEYKIGHCWTEDEIKPVIKNVKDGILADGNKDEYNVEEMEERNFRASGLDGLRPLEEIRSKL